MRAGTFGPHSAGIGLSLCEDAEWSLVKQLFQPARRDQTRRVRRLSRECNGFNSILEKYGETKGRDKRSQHGGISDSTFRWFSWFPLRGELDPPEKTFVASPPLDSGRRAPSFVHFGRAC